MKKIQGQTFVILSITIAIFFAFANKAYCRQEHTNNNSCDGCHGEGSCCITASGTTVFGQWQEITK